MKRCVAILGVVVLVSGLASPCPAQSPTFDLSWSVPASLPDGTPGAVIPYDAVGRLTTNGLTAQDEGAQGWSLSMDLAGGAIVSATTAGTIVDSLYDEGFNKTEVIDPAKNAGKQGAVSAVVLSFTKAVNLPPTGTVDLVRLGIELTVPDPVEENGEPACAPNKARVSFVDGRVGSGQPVDNKITYKGESVLPTLGSAETSVCPKIQRPLTFAATAVGGTETDPGVFEIEVSLPAVQTPVNAGIDLVSVLEGESGAQGWSISVATGDCFGVSSATTEGTSVPLYYSGGFNKTEVVDPAKNGGQQGAVSAIVLSFTEKRELPPVGTELILVLKGSIDGSGLANPDDTTPPCLVTPLGPDSAGLTGSGQPVKTAVTVAGVTKNPGVAPADIRLVPAREARFRRGDANDDGKLDIADPIWIINELFRQGAPTVCQDAADANDDGFVDTSDAVYLISYQFGLPNPSVPPSAPFPACGTDPTEDTLECATTTPSCAAP